ncbi:hypothetical protein UK23_13035 [Lentzea aerocolonigenes]|uniref:DUF2690 domain-containing protein n=1 Tax=Lentzea aerocolonigenes TaxID=68170 RepID=A0A0F0H1P6_LENAE|nr:DUF2690 domain-containing protein [Lentzea aerocolonigenes]KJK49669.1 hypothetical protein UK23_13035 [Lentzea aerocolonigenes]
MKSTALIAAAALTLLVAPDAQAASCSGRSCNDKDPVATGCSSGSTVADSSPMYPSGTAELRWSPTCKTNWVRITNYPGGDSGLRITVWSSSDRVGFIAPGTPGNHWGNMVYAPGCARGEVLYVAKDGSHQTERLASSDC